MKVMVIKELEGIEVPGAYTIDIANGAVKNCIGCWSCWWKTPGRCTFADLDQFYHEYVTADKAIFFAKVTKGFVSGELKTLFDRMIPLYLPYMDYSTGESMHVQRYEKYPDVDFYYEGDFDGEEGRKVFEDYIGRVFYQFHTKNFTVKPIGEYTPAEDK